MPIKETHIFFFFPQQSLQTFNSKTLPQPQPQFMATIVDHLNPTSFFFSMSASHEWAKSVKKSAESNLMEGKAKKLRSLFEQALSKMKKPKSKPIVTSSSSPPVSFSSASIFKPAFSFKQFGLIGSASRGSRVSWMFNNGIRLPGTEDRIVVYFTTLRGVRRTYEDCYSLRMILRGFRVEVDERDLSMDMGYREELENVMGEKSVKLPKVFIKGVYVGGAEEIRQLNEGGELGKLLKGIPLRDRFVCDGCGDARFVVCLNCDGSRKVFCEEEDEARRCGECNENGLVRCPTCCR